MLVAQRIGSDSSADIITLHQYQYDPLGRFASETNALGGVTSYGYAVVNSQACITNVYPDGGTSICVNYATIP